MNGIFLIIGGNLGNREEQLSTCRQLIEQQGIQILRSSTIYETAAWGNTETPPYLNQVVEIRTSLSPEELMSYCLKTEAIMGRTRHQKWESRVIDIDLLFYHHVCLNHANLILPHPHITERRFVLTPLVELIPGEIHPINRVQIQELLAQCSDPLEVTPYTSGK